MKLFFNSASPYARKVMVVAIESGVDQHLKCVELALTPVSPSAELNSDNPLGKVPTLVLEDGSTLFDSRVICEYLNSLGPGNLFPEPGEQRWHALRRQAIADGICDAALLARYEGFVRPEEKRWNEWSDGQLGKMRRALSLLESEAGGFADTCDIGTLSIAVALDYLDFRFNEEAWRSKCPALDEWHKRISERESLLGSKPQEPGG